MAVVTYFRHSTTGCTCMLSCTQRSVLQNGANFVLRIISVKVYGLGFFGKRTDQRLEPGSDFNRNVDKKA
jgi:hypothetical protein